MMTKDLTFTIKTIIDFHFTANTLFDNDRNIIDKELLKILSVSYS